MYRMRPALSRRSFGPVHANVALLTNHRSAKTVRDARDARRPNAFTGGAWLTKLRARQRLRRTHQQEGTYVLPGPNGQVPHERGADLPEAGRRGDILKRRRRSEKGRESGHSREDVLFLQNTSSGPTSTTHKKYTSRRQQLPAAAGRCIQLADIIRWGGSAGRPLAMQVGQALAPAGATMTSTTPQRHAVCATAWPGLRRAGQRRHAGGAIDTVFNAVPTP